MKQPPYGFWSRGIEGTALNVEVLQIAGLWHWQIRRPGRHMACLSHPGRFASLAWARRSITTTLKSLGLKLISLPKEK